MEFEGYKTVDIAPPLIMWQDCPEGGECWDPHLCTRHSPYDTSPVYVRQPQQDMAIQDKIFPQSETLQGLVKDSITPVSIKQCFLRKALVCCQERTARS